MRVSLYCGAIDEAQVELDLTCDGLVVLEAMRPQADRIASTVRKNVLDSHVLSNEDDEPPVVNHLSCRAPDGGFVDYLCMPSVFGRDCLHEAPAIVLTVVDAWRSGVPRDRFVWRSPD